jgi:hypothetical protein
MALTRIKSSNIADETVVAADIADGSVTDAKIQTGVSSSKLTGNLPAVSGAALTNLTAANLSGALPAISGANLTGVSTDTSAMENNIAILAFKTQSANNLAKFNLVDQVIDEYKDGTGATYTTAGQTGSTATDGYLATVTEVIVSGAYTADANTLLLLHIEDTAFTDSSTATNKGNPTIRGSVTRSSTQAKFGTYSALVGSSTSNADSLEFADHAHWDAGSISYTIDYWLYLIALPPSAQTYPVSRFSGSGDWGNYIDANGAMRHGIWGVSEIYTSNSVVPIGSWHHWAIVKNGGSDTKIYKDGVQVATGSGNFSDCSSPLWIGGQNTSITSTSSLNGYIDEVRISNIARWTSGFTPNENSTTTETNATGTAISTANTALTAPTTGDIVMLIENASGTATLNTDLKAYVSRNGGTGWDQATLVDKGSWGTNKKILVANNVAFSNSASGTDMRYKIEWANQASGTKVTRVHATSLAWA